MSLNVALFTALSGLSTNQAAIQLTSNNVANANTVGYTRKIADQHSVVLDGVGAGVRLGEVQRRVDAFLLRELRATTTTAAQAAVRDAFFERVGQLFGQPGDAAALGAGIDRFAAGLQSVAASPENVSAQLTTVAAAQALARQFNDMSAELQRLRLEADQQIAAAVEKVNELLQRIDALNGDISRNTLLQLPTADLEDQRDVAVSALSEQFEVSYFVRDNGEMVIFTPNGRPLLDGGPIALAHAAVSSMTAGFTYPGAIDGIDLAGVDITAELGAGRIGALIEQRDRSLPDLVEEVSLLARTLRDEVNRVHNTGTSVPAATSLTSSRAQTGTAVSLTGTLTVALLNPDGTQAFSGAVPAPATLDAAGFAAAINGVLAGFGVGASASQTGGALTLDGAGFGIALSGGTIDPGGGATATNVSDFLHLNDLLVGDDPAGLDFAAVLGVRSDIAQSPHLLSRGQLSQDPVSLQFYVGAGDNRVAQALAAKFDEQLAFAAAGGLPQTGASLAGYANTILSANAAAASDAADDAAFQATLLETLAHRAQSESGVNIDEELANMVVLQNAYAASARMISVAAEMYDVLLALAA